MRKDNKSKRNHLDPSEKPPLSNIYQHSVFIQISAEVESGGDFLEGLRLFYFFLVCWTIIVDMVRYVDHLFPGVYLLQWMVVFLNFKFIWTGNFLYVQIAYTHAYALEFIKQIFELMPDVLEFPDEIHKCLVVWEG